MCETAWRSLTLASYLMGLSAAEKCEHCEHTTMLVG
jgi:hypothetical protein